jgi:hypothetical protein
MRIRGSEGPQKKREADMDDFDDGDVGLPDEMSTELPDLDSAVESEVEIDLEGETVAPGGRSSGGARAQVASTPRKSSGAPKAVAKPAKKAPAKKAKAAKKARPAKKKAAKKKAKPAKKAAKKAKRKAGRKK